MNADAEREAFAAFALRMRGAALPHDLLQAMEVTPRSAFLPGQYGDLAWSTDVIPIDCGESMESVDLQALAIGALAIENTNRVLEVGTGSGYTAAIMARRAARVFSVDRYRTLVGLARSRLDYFGLTNAVLRHADGSEGFPAEGPFDRIMVWAAFEVYPRHFVEQLSSGGTMVCAIGPAEDRQTLVRLTKVGSRFDRQDLGPVRFQPLLKGIAAAL
jgi:protein-L-isoaspartate(D-aspartate) O-methyltransferase